MDVVKTNISKLGGVIDITSELGIGTKFTITLPITLAIISALIVEVADQQFAIPLASVQDVGQLDADSVLVIDGREAVKWRRFEQGRDASVVRCRALVWFGQTPRTRTTRRGQCRRTACTRRFRFATSADAKRASGWAHEYGVSVSAGEKFAHARTRPQTGR